MTTTAAVLHSSAAAAAVVAPTAVVMVVVVVDPAVLVAHSFWTASLLRALLTPLISVPFQFVGDIFRASFQCHFTRHFRRKGKKWRKIKGF
jgi:hypothetical protein